MKRILVIAVLAMAISPLTSCATASKKAESESNAQPSASATAESQINQEVIEVMKVEGQLRDAVLQGDTEALNRLYSDDYITTNALGAARTKAELLDEFRNGTLRFESINDDDLKVHVSGDTAVVTGQRTQKSWWKGQDTSGQYRYIRVLVKRRGHWQPIAFQATTISHQ